MALVTRRYNKGGTKDNVHEDTSSTKDNIHEPSSTSPLLL